jgi:hypothetical protein
VVPGQPRRARRSRFVQVTCSSPLQAFSPLATLLVNNVERAAEVFYPVSPSPKLNSSTQAHRAARRTFPAVRFPLQ